MQDKQIPHKLQEQLNISIAESSVVFEEDSIIHNHSIIDELDDFEFENKKPASKVTSKISTNTNTIKIRESLKDSEKKIEEMIGSKMVAKFNKAHHLSSHNNNSDRHQYIPSKTSIPTSPKRAIIFNEQQASSLKKLKEQQQKSVIVRLKEFILNEMVPKCQKCERALSEINKKGLVCVECERDEKCFPLIGLLYEMENPSFSNEKLLDIWRQTENELNKLERVKKQLLILKQNLQKIIKLENAKDKEFGKTLLRDITNFRKDKRFKKKDSKFHHQDSSIFQIDFDLYFQQFSAWSQLKPSQGPFFDELRKIIGQEKPLCLKEPTSDILPYLNNVTTNFNNIELRISISDRIPVGFTFSGHIKNLTIVVDGSFCLSRQNFLLIQKIDRLKLQFKQKKTSRELKQLFYMLPKSNSLEFEFDYRIHSHISSQTFPIICRACERQSEELLITIKNARQEILRELFMATKSISPKKRLKIHIEMNPFIQIRDKYEEEYGSLIVENMLRGAKDELVEVSLCLPFYLDYQRIYEYLINNDFQKLVLFEMKGLNEERQVGTMGKLWKKIIAKKKHFLCLLWKGNSLNTQILERNPIVRKRVLSLLI